MRTSGQMREIRSAETDHRALMVDTEDIRESTFHIEI
jgi:hypothetical protein